MSSEPPVPNLTSPVKKVPSPYINMSYETEGDLFGAEETSQDVQHDSISSKGTVEESVQCNYTDGELKIAKDDQTKSDGEKTFESKNLIDSNTQKNKANPLESKSDSNMIDNSTQTTPSFLSYNILQEKKSLRRQERD